MNSRHKTSKHDKPKKQPTMAGVLEKDFELFIQSLPLLTENQLTKLTNEVFAESMERGGQEDIEDFDSLSGDGLENDTPWDD